MSLLQLTILVFLGAPGLGFLVLADKWNNARFLAFGMVLLVVAALLSLWIPAES